MDEKEIKALVVELISKAGVRHEYKVSVYQSASIDGECQAWPRCKISISSAAAALRPDLVRAALAHEVGHARQPRAAILAILVCAGLLAIGYAALLGMPSDVPLRIVSVVAVATGLSYAWGEIDAERWAARTVGKQTVLELRGQLPGLAGRAQQAVSAWILAR